MIAIILYYYIYLIIYRGKTKTYRREGRERTRAKDAAAIAPATRTRGRAATSSASGRSHRHTSTPIYSDRAATGQRLGLSVILPASAPSSSPLSGGEGMAASQPGRAIPSTLPGGAVRIVPDESRQAGSASTYQCGGAVFLANQSSQDRPHKCIALNINYLISPLGYAVQSRCSGETILIPKV